jgi:hypothetical protein
MVLLREDARQKAGEDVITDTATFDAQMDLQDQVQGVAQMLAWLVTRMGGDPAVIGSVPRDVPPRGVRAA